jgi:integrase
LQYPPDPPTVEEIIAVMRTAGETSDGLRQRGFVVVLWRAGLRISEALALTEPDLDAARGAILVRRGKGGKRREVGMDRWPGSNFRRGSEREHHFRSARCSVCCADRHEDARAHPPAFAPSSAGRPSRRASGGGSPHISSATRMPSRCLAKLFPY